MTVVLILVFLTGVPSTLVAGQSKPPAVDFKAYYGCLDREAEMAVKNAVERGVAFYDVDPKRIGDQVFATCTSRFSNGTPVQSSDRASAEHALTALMHADTEKRLSAQRKQAERQAALDAPKLQAESAAASRRYGDCLFASAREIALNSTEPAEVVTHAAFAACRDERKLISEVHRRYRDNLFSDEALDIADKQIADSLILEIIKARANRPSPPPVAQPDTPPPVAQPDKAI